MTELLPNKSHFELASNFPARSPKDHLEITVEIIYPHHLAPYNLMADHRVPSQQASPILANIFPLALHQLHDQVQHVAFLTVLLIMATI